MTHASRNTTTGLKFEKKIKIKGQGIDLSQTKLYKYLKEKEIDWTKIISRQIRPDEAYFDPETKILSVYEKKFQKTEGSADEKPQTCAFKIFEFRKIGKAIGAEEVTYTYIFNDWFKNPKYKDMLDYIKTVDGCDYIFMGDEVNVIK